MEKNMVTKVVVMNTLRECEGYLEDLRLNPLNEARPFRISVASLEAVRDDERIMVVPVGDVVRRLAGVRFKTFEYSDSVLSNPLWRGAERLLTIAVG